MKLWLTVAAVYGLFAVIFGAFGAHALRTRVDADLLAVWRTAVDYQFYHALALLLVGLWMRSEAQPALTVAAACFAAGVLVFSGSLYLLVLSGVRILGAVTPLGGLLFIAGWIALLVAVWRSR